MRAKSEYPDFTTLFVAKKPDCGRRLRKGIHKKGEKDMQKRDRKKVSFGILSMVLIVAMTLFAWGCGKEAKGEVSATESFVTLEGGVLGEGSRVFPFTVVDQDGNETEFEIHTDQEMVGAALQELGLIAGDEGEFGLYVKTVNGITADYDADGVYWAFYVNGDYAALGVDSTAIAEGERYSFKVEKG